MTPIEKALRLDQPWTVPDVLERLSDAAKHLLDVHNCDMHGHEGVRECVELAREMAKELREAAAQSTYPEKIEKLPHPSIPRGARVHEFVRDPESEYCGYCGGGFANNIHHSPADSTQGRNP